MEKTLQKYRIKYSEVISKLEDSIKEQERLKIDLQKTREKSHRKISDINEVRD